MSETGYGEDRYTKCAEFTAELRGIRLAEYVELCFDDKYVSTVTGSIHSVGYKYEFVGNEKEIRRRERERKEMLEKVHIKSESKETPEMVISTLE